MLTRLLKNIVLTGLLAGVIAQAQVTLPNGTTVPRNKMIVFIFIGHSNMAGRHSPYDTSPNARGWAYGANNRTQWEPCKDLIFENASGAGPATPFVKQMITEYGTADPALHFAVIQNAASGVKATHYHSGQSRYNSVIARCKEIQNNVTFGGIVTMLGLIERTDGTARARFAQDLTKAVSDIRTGLGLSAAELPAYVQDYEREACAEGGTTNCGDRDFRASCPGAQTIISQLSQVPGMLGSSAIIATNGIPCPDQCHHFSMTGYREFANRCVLMTLSKGWDSIWKRSDSQNPTIPTGLVAGTVTDQSAEIKWTAATDDVGIGNYIVTWSPGSGAKTVDGNVLSTVASGLTAGTTYSFQVEAKDLSGKLSGKSTSLSVTTKSPDTEKPTAPTHLAVVSKTNTSVTLSWSASTDNLGVAGYRIFSGTTQVAQVSGTATTGSVTSGLTGGQTYTFTVKAFDYADNISDASQGITVVLPSSPQVSLPFKINLGGDALIDFVADQPYSASAAYGYVGTTTGVVSSPTAVAGTELDAVFQTMRYRDMTYRIGVPNGNYDVTLMFAEFWRDNPVSAGSGYRSFAVTIEGVAIAGSPVDIVAAVGKNAALTLTSTVSVSDGFIDIVMSAGTGGDPIMSGIGVAAGGTTLAEPIVFTSPTGATTVAAGDVLHIKWKTDLSLVNNVYFTISNDHVEPISIMAANSISSGDPEWGDFAWTVPGKMIRIGDGGVPVEECLAGQSWTLEAIDYNDNYVIAMPGLLTISGTCESSVHNRTMKGSANLWSVKALGSGGRLELEIGQGVEYRVRVLTLAGKCIGSANGQGAGVTAINLAGRASGTLLLDMNIGGKLIRSALIMP